MPNARRKHVKLEVLAAVSLGLPPGWNVERVAWEERHRSLGIHLKPDPKAPWRCSSCGNAAPIYDTISRTWRHLDLWSYPTWVNAKVPRTKCPGHGVHTVDIPWGEPRRRLTHAFNTITMALLAECRIGTVARTLNMTWDQANRLKKGRGGAGAGKK